MEFIRANWKAPNHVHALTTTRLGGVSQGVYQGLNVGDHVADCEIDVQRNRQILTNELNLIRHPQWLSQVHGTDVVKANDDGLCREADGCWTNEIGLACVVMTADCLPVFFSNRDGSQVAVAHAGWRGLLDGVLESTLKIFKDVADVHVWLGPAIGPKAFEVGAEVYEQFCDHAVDANAAFIKTDPLHDKYLANIYCLATQRLQHLGVTHITSTHLCTYSDSERFYSYRREGKTGRLASLIWIE